MGNVIHVVIFSMLLAGIYGCQPTPTTASGSYAPGGICSGDLIFEDVFNSFDLNKWKHEVTLAGGGNWEFQWYTNDRRNSAVENRRLCIKPTLTSDYLGEHALTSSTLNINQHPPYQCTNAEYYGCVRTGTSTHVLNPIRSARVQTSESFAFRYGRVEVSAKLPAGDWLWPAIWLLPRHNVYGGWPTSGEIDIMESRGNRNLNKGGTNIGVQQMGSTLHWGPDPSHNAFYKTHWEKNNRDGFDRAFHKYELIWTPQSITFKLDGETVGSVAPPLGGFYELGEFSRQGVGNPWSSGSKMAPFDQQFYIIINLAVGGVNHYFPDDASNPGGKPWPNNSPQAATDFWNGRNQWLPTWNLGRNDDSHLQIDYVRVYAL